MPIRPPLFLLLAALVAAAPAQAAPDPLEGVNRRIHAFNELVRARVLGPAVETYVAATSPGFREGVGNALANLAEPISALSSVAAWDLDRAANAAMRFGINTTLGLGGVRDAASAMGYPRRAFAPADAACSWGVPSGPYLVLPVIGPSTLRDAAAMMAAGAALSQAIGPEALLGWQSGEMFVGYAAIHQELQRIEASALDAYAVHRSIFLQRRAAVCPGDGTGDPGE